MRNMSMYNAPLSVQQKVVATNNAFGNYAISDQQGTSRQMYDTLALDGTNNFQFFQNCQSRVYPFTNLNQNKLQVGESMAVQRLHFSVIVFDPLTAQPLTVETFDTAALDPFYMADWSVFFDTVQEVKDTSLVAARAEFNKFANFDGNEVITLDNNIVLPSDVQFRCQLKTPTYTPVDDTYIRCTWEGFGTIFSPKNQF